MTENLPFEFHVIAVGLELEQNRCTVISSQYNKDRVELLKVSFIIMLITNLFSYQLHCCLLFE